MKKLWECETIGEGTHFTGGEFEHNPSARSNAEADIDKSDFKKNFHSPIGLR